MRYNSIIRKGKIITISMLEGLNLEWEFLMELFGTRESEVHKSPCIEKRCCSEKKKKNQRNNKRDVEDGHDGSL